MKRMLALLVMISLVLSPAPVVPASAEGSPANRITSTSQQPGGGVIYFRGLTLNTEAGEPALSPPLAQVSPPGEGFHIVQFTGPVQPGWLDELLASGLEIVAYLPDYAYLVWGNQPSQSLEQTAAQTGAVRWDGLYQPYYRLAPELRGPAENAASPGAEQNSVPASVDVTVQFYNTHLLKSSLEQITQAAETVYQPPVGLGNLTHIRVRLPTQLLAVVAAWPDVINIEPYVRPEKLDEVQGQLMAGNVRVEDGMLLPSGPGYLAWLDSLGFPKDPEAYPIVSLADDGLDTGDPDGILHPDFYVEGSRDNPDRVVSINNCTADESAGSLGGHGSLNAGIMAGYNNLDGPPYRDSSGYRYGLGISPYGRLAATKVFGLGGWFDLTNCGSSFTEMMDTAYENGARITSNSWGAPVSGAYTVDSQAFDILTRDGSTQPGSQEMLHVFASGNSGPDSQTVNSPGTAKNVLTVGATESVRDHNVLDGCFLDEADNAGDVASFSSRGPSKDGRMKPDLTAPGTHIQGPASQAAEFDGTGICGGLPPSGGFAPYYPAGQTLYTWSSGTSHSTPAVSGAAQLIYNYYERVMNPGETPSPAMLKALLLNTPRFLTGTDAGSTLPSEGQGWGSVNLGMAFDGAQRILVDQTRVLDASGETVRLVGQVSDPSKPLRVSLVWTDAPAVTSAGKSLVNDLDLEVSIEGQTYKGNVFNGEYSAAGGLPDKLNNVENVFLPAGLRGSFQISISASNLAGDAVPDSRGLTNQDYALVVYNGVEVEAPVLLPAETDWREQTGNGNGAIDPGETIDIKIEVANRGTGPAPELSAVLRVDDPYVTLISAVSEYPGILPGESAANLLPFRIKVHKDAPCSHTIPVVLQINDSSNLGDLDVPDLVIGEVLVHQYDAQGTPLAIPDYDRDARRNGEVEIPIEVSDTFDILDLDVLVDIRHSWDADLNLSLIPPGGQPIDLSSRNGGMGDDYRDTIFDDEADLPVTDGLPPFTGRFRPEQPLAPLYGQPANGQWIFKVEDSGPSDLGEVVSVSLAVKEARCSVYNSMAEMKVPQGGNLRSAMPGEIVSFSVEITNLGSEAERFRLSADTLFPVRFPDSIGPLDPGESETIQLLAKVPVGVKPRRGNLPITLTAEPISQPGGQSDLVMFIFIGQRFWFPMIRH